MNKPRYTPGPLVVVGPYSNGATVSFGLRREGKEIGYVATISRVMPNDYRNDFAADKVAQEELEANVKVYAAAPEMAEALKTLLAETESLLRDIDRTTKATKQNADSKSMSAEYEAMFDAACNAARAALQKAGLL